MYQSLITDQPWFRRISFSIFATFFATLTAAWSAEIVLVLSAEREPYREAQIALEAALKQAGMSSKTVLLDPTKNDLSIPENTRGIVSIGTPAAKWLHENPKPGKMTYCMVSDPEAAGLTRPPAISGITTDVPITTQLQLIKEALPLVRVIGTLYQKNNPLSVTVVTELRKQAPNGWQIEAVAIDAFDAPALAIDALFDKRVDIVWTTPDPTIYNNATVRSLLLTALRRRTPVFGFSTSFVRAGALLGVGIEPQEQGQQAAKHMLALLSENVTNESIIAPNYDICLNLVVAQKLSLTLPPLIIERAKQLFQPGR
jgi:ABC-type uncharacterized transport system substrate-binding protein